MLLPNLIVIDTGNYYPKQRDGKIAGIEQGLPRRKPVGRTAAWAACDQGFQ